MRALMLATGLLWATAAGAVEDYETCTALVSADPETAAVEAERWQRFGGGAAAAHCRALALAALGSDLAAAEVLVDAVALHPELAPAAQAAMLAQAGRIYLDQGAADRAAYVANLAAQLAPEAEAVLRVRAAVRLARGEAAAAAADLDALLARYPATAEDVIRRAAARRLAGDAAGARADAARAVQMAPDDPRAWLELGAAAAAQGDRDTARRAWLAAIDRDPARAGGAVGRAAQLSLQRMELGAE